MQANNNLYRESAWQALSLQQHGQALLTPSFKAWAICTGLGLWVASMVALLSTHSFIEKATVTGYISTTMPSITISPKENVGVITQIFVENGDMVEQGEALLRVKRPAQLIIGEQGIAKQLSQLNQHLSLLQDTQNQNQADNLQQQTFLTQQLHAAQEQQRAISQQVHFLNERINMAANDVVRLSGLHSQKLISLDALNNAQQTLLSMRQQLAQFSQNLADNDITQAQLEAQLAKLQQQTALQTTQTQLNQLPVAQQITELENQQSYTIFAPRAGIVSNLLAQAGDDISRFSVLLKLADPSQNMQLLLAVPTSAAGFISTEQQVRVRLDAFPHQKYGTVDAVIKKISKTITLPNESHAHAVPLQEPVFMVQANLNQDYIVAKGERIGLKEGMTVQADVMLSERTLLEWLLSPLYSLRGSL